MSVVLGAGQQGQLNQSLVVMVHYEHYVYTVFLYFPLYRFTYVKLLFYRCSLFIRAVKAWKSHRASKLAF